VNNISVIALRLEQPEIDYARNSDNYFHATKILCEVSHNFILFVNKIVKSNIPVLTILTNCKTN